MKRTMPAKRAAHVDRELLWFSILTPAEQSQVVRRLADQGRGDRDIASLTTLNVGTVRRILAERTP